MESNVKKSIQFFLWEFLMVFFGVLLAFWVNDWGAQRRDRQFLNNMMGNMIEDVRSDSINIIKAIEYVNTQHDSLEALINNLRLKKYQIANEHIGWTYITYNVFEPTTETFSSMVFGGDMKLIDDFNLIRSIKELNHINQKLASVHEKYYSAVEAFRNEFICPNELSNFDFKRNEIEFWNRINFLKANVKYYKEALVMAQKIYAEFLSKAQLRNYN